MVFGGINPMIGGCSSKKKEICKHSHTEKRQPCKDGDKDWSYTATNQ